jgi:hypothetical protein
MTQKEALIRALKCAQSLYGGDAVKMKAARAFYIISWLDDMNWHREASDIMQKALATPNLNKAFDEVQADTDKIHLLDQLASIMNGIFGWSVRRDEWKATAGAKFVEELWALVCAPT